MTIEKNPALHGSQSWPPTWTTHPEVGEIQEKKKVDYVPVNTDDEEVEDKKEGDDDDDDDEHVDPSTHKYGLPVGKPQQVVGNVNLG